MKTTFSVAGLILTLIGAGILASGGLTSIAARIRREQSITPGAWYQNFVIWLSRCFGSKDVLDTEDTAVSSATVQFWGFLFIMVGTVLQVFGVL